MKNPRFVALAVLAASTLPMSVPAFAAPQTLEGVISDAMCVKKHMMPGKSDADCIKECVKDGSSYVLVVGDKVYSFKGNASTIAPFAGKHVQVQGDVKENTINLTKIQEAKGMSHAGMKM